MAIEIKTYSDYVEELLTQGMGYRGSQELNTFDRIAASWYFEDDLGLQMHFGIRDAFTGNYDSSPLMSAELNALKIIWKNAREKGNRTELGKQLRNPEDINVLASPIVRANLLSKVIETLEAIVVSRMSTKTEPAEFVDSVDIPGQGLRVRYRRYNPNTRYFDWYDKWFPSKSESKLI